MAFLRVRHLIPAACAFVASALLAAPQSAHAIPVAPAPSIDQHVQAVQYRAGGARRVAVRPVARPGVRPYRGVAVRPGRAVVVAPGYRPGVRPIYPAYRPVVRPVRPAYYYGNWYRPYRWNPGAAIAAGAAIGFIGAAAAASYYGPPPAAGLCWYYTNPSRTRGFWDVCPY